MKKLMVGLLIGVGLSLGITAYADDIVSLIGKKVEGSFPLIINNVRSEKDVLVIDGTSYIPVRSAAALFEYEVTFNADMMVVMNKKSDLVIDGVKQLTATPTPSATPTATPATTITPIPTTTPVPTSTLATPATTEPLENKAATIDRIKINIIGVNSQIIVVLEEIKKKETLLKSVQSDINQAALTQSTKLEVARLKTVLSDSTKQLDKLNKSLKEQE